MDAEFVDFGFRCPHCSKIILENEQEKKVPIYECSLCNKIYREKEKAMKCCLTKSKHIEQKQFKK